jgi:hypothetical protein
VCSGVDGCLALRKIIRFESSSCAKAATDSWCIELVISAMDNHRNEAEIQMEGCNFLSLLSSAAEENFRKMVLDADVLRIIPVVRALRIHQDDAQVKHAARLALIVISGPSV